MAPDYKKDQDMKITNTHIYFYSRKDIPSQHYPAGFKYKGLYFRTCEHWMMFIKQHLHLLGLTAKIEDAIEYMQKNPNSLYEQILNAKTPQQAKMLGRQVSPFNKPLWDAHCDEAVFWGNLMKFEQNKECYDFMSKYANRKFVEAASGDLIWGVGLGENDPLILDSSNWRGENKLGNQLNKVNLVLFQGTFSVGECPV